MTLNQIANHEWTKVLAIIITLLTLALAAEHRQTLVEEANAANGIVIKEVKEHQSKTDELMTWTQIQQMRIVTILDAIEKRHAREDEK
jgi:bifunctional ADP-heptose synthase (sugar kinase/adenylyltransferase)